MQCCWAELSCLRQYSVEFIDLLLANTTILSEQEEIFRVFVEFSKVSHVLVHVVEMFFHRGSSEEDTSVAAFNSVFLAWWLVIWHALYDLNITD